MNKSSLINNAESAQAVVAEASDTPSMRSLVKRWNSAELFAGARELLIEHGNEEYRLRLTNQGKLILTK
jgi:hemin uptake protein HemP